MKQIPKLRSMNFPVYDEMLDRYIDKTDLLSSLEKGALNGVEVILAGDPRWDILPEEYINGVHLYFHSFWMDYWRGNEDRLNAIFDSKEQWVEYYGSEGREGYLRCLKHDLDFAKDHGAKYVVFHVSEVTPEETITFQRAYTDEEVIDAAIEVINEVLDGSDYTFDFLIENLWWAGFNLKNPAMTRRLLDGIHYEKKGILMDTGHLMMNDLTIRTPEDAVAYISSVIEEHEKEGVDLISLVKGMHLHMTMGQQAAERGAREGVDFTDVPFYEQFQQSYEHARTIDQHLPFLGEGVRELIERIHPDYLTMEFQPSSREEYEEYIKAQAKELGYL